MPTEAGRNVLIFLLQHGNHVPSVIAESCDLNPKYVSQLLNDLESEGYVERLGGGVWGLTPSGVSMAQSIVRERDV